MRIVQGPLVHDMSGKIGGVSVCSRKRRLYLRPLICRHYPASDAQLACQAKLAHIRFLRDDLATWDTIADFPGAWTWLAHHTNTTPYHLWLKLNLAAENQDKLLVATPRTSWTAAQGGPIHQVHHLTYQGLPSFWARVTWTSTNGPGYTLSLFVRTRAFPDWLHPTYNEPPEEDGTVDIRTYYLKWAYQLYAIPFRDADKRCGQSQQIKVTPY